MSEPTVARGSAEERMVTLTLPHGQMCALLGALNWARRALRNMPAGLRVPLDTLDELDVIYREFWPAFDRAALNVPADPRSAADA